MVATRTQRRFLDAKAPELSKPLLRPSTTLTPYRADCKLYIRELT